MRQTLHFSNTYNLKASAGTVLKPGIVPLWYIITMWLMVPEEWFLPQEPNGHGSVTGYIYTTL